MKIVPIEPTLKDMKIEAGDCEQKARIGNEPDASILKEKAAVLREWITSLKTGAWRS